MFWRAPVVNSLIHSLLEASFLEHLLQHRPWVQQRSQRWLIQHHFPKEQVRCLICNLFWLQVVLKTMWGSVRRLTLTLRKADRRLAWEPEAKILRVHETGLSNSWLRPGLDLPRLNEWGLARGTHVRSLPLVSKFRLTWTGLAFLLMEASPVGNTHAWFGVGSELGSLCERGLAFFYHQLPVPNADLGVWSDFIHLTSGINTVSTYSQNGPCLVWCCHTPVHSFSLDRFRNVISAHPELEPGILLDYIHTRS